MEQFPLNEYVKTSPALNTFTCPGQLSLNINDKEKKKFATKVLKNRFRSEHKMKEKRLTSKRNSCENMRLLVTYGIINWTLFSVYGLFIVAWLGLVTVVIFLRKSFNILGFLHLFFCPDPVLSISPP